MFSELRKSSTNDVALLLGPSRDHVPGRKDGTRYLAPSSRISNRTGPGCWPRIPLLRRDGTRYLAPSSRLSKRTGPGCWPRIPLLRKDGTRYLAPSPVLRKRTGPSISTGSGTGFGKDYSDSNFKLRVVLSNSLCPCAHLHFCQLKHKLTYFHTNTQIHKYTITQIKKYTNTQIHKYTNTNKKCTNTQIHKYTNTLPKYLHPSIHPFILLNWRFKISWYGLSCNFENCR